MTGMVWTDNRQHHYRSLFYRVDSFHPSVCVCVCVCVYYCSEPSRVTKNTRTNGIEIKRHLPSVVGLMIENDVNEVYPQSPK
jgi:hypothetical protein